MEYTTDFSEFDYTGLFYDERAIFQLYKESEYEKALMYWINLIQ
jgi:hypothetical protein